jgi:hypothetical protein
MTFVVDNASRRAYCTNLYCEASNMNAGGGNFVEMFALLNEEQGIDEAVVAGLSYDHFRYTDPERRLALKLYMFPSASDPGRVRATFDIAYNLELWSDLFWKLDFYSDYDNEPISVSASTIDYGFTSSVAYKF